MILLACACSAHGAEAPTSAMTMRYKEGLVHGFLVLSTLDGNPLADGDFVQIAHGDRITNHLVFHFKDGSVQDEKTVFSQGGEFRLISYRLLQKGPAFQRSTEMSIVASTGEVVVHYTDDEGQEKTADDRLKLPPDLANGLIVTLLKNLRPESPPTKVSMVVATPKPRLVKVAISAPGQEPFTLGASSRKAIHYILKVEMGGVAGLVAPLLGKQPPDNNVWILPGEAPAFVKSETLSYPGGPMWRTELLSPIWPQTMGPDSKDGGSSKR